MNIVIQIKDGFVERVWCDESIESVIVLDYDTIETGETDPDGNEVYQYDAAAVLSPRLVAETIKHYERSITERLEG